MICFLSRLNIQFSQDLRSCVRLHHNATFCLPFDFAQDERQQVRADLLVCGFSALRAEKPHTIEK